MLLGSLGLFMVVKLTLDHEQLRTGFQACFVCGLHGVASRPGLGSGLAHGCMESFQKGVSNARPTADRPGELELVAAFSRGGGFGLE